MYVNVFCILTSDAVKQFHNSKTAVFTNMNRIKNLFFIYYINIKSLIVYIKNMHDYYSKEKSSYK